MKRTILVTLATIVSCVLATATIVAQTFQPESPTSHIVVDVFGLPSDLVIAPRATVGAPPRGRASVTPAHVTDTQPSPFVAH